MFPFGWRGMWRPTPWDDGAAKALLEGWGNDFVCLGEEGLVTDCGGTCLRLCIG